MLDGYVSEKEQIESIRKWWKANGRFLLVAILIGLGIGYGWRYWHTFEIRRAENAAMIYQSVLQADEKNNSVTVAGGAKILMEQFSSSPYASLSALLWAKELVAKNDLSNALIKLQWVVHEGDTNRLKQIARIESARILLAENKTSDAMNQLKIINDKSFLPIIEWVQGDIYSKEGNSKLAKNAYFQAKNGLSGFSPADSLLNQFLADSHTLADSSSLK